MLREQIFLNKLQLLHYCSSGMETDSLEPVLRKELSAVLAMGEIQLIADVSPCQPSLCPAAAKQGEQACEGWADSTQSPGL